MADEKILVVQETSLQRWEKRSELKEYLLSGADEPLVFRKCLGEAWPEVVSEWSPVGLSRLLGRRETSFKLCPRRDSSEYSRRFTQTDTVFETQCLHVRATFEEFAEWLEAASTALPPLSAVSTAVEPLTKKHRTEEENTVKPNPKASPNSLLKYSPSQYWIYADYKYMSQLCQGLPHLLSAIDWSLFGFEGVGGADSTLWVGSEEAHTPCHYDTYGCNIVAQVWGRKKWTLFPPSDSPLLYPTRIPYEESSVFSQVNVACPDLKRHPHFPSTTKYEVVLEAGDVLFVPRHWWHYVQCLENSVSINTWISLPSDNRERVKEAVVRATMAGWLRAIEGSVSNGSDSEGGSSEQGSQCNPWVNPNEEIFSHQKNLELLSITLAECQAPPTGRPRPLISHSDWVNVLTSDRVVDAVATTLLEKHRD